MGTKGIDTTKLSAEERAAIEARRAYKRAWNAKNKKKLREYNHRYWLKRAAEQTAAKNEQAT